MTSVIGNKWDELLQEQYKSRYFLDLQAFLKNEYAQKAVYPPREAVFCALALTPPECVKVVILGQDPYIRKGQANGLAFSVPQGCTLPPSLKNIFAEVASDTNTPQRIDGCLDDWARQGVLLLNTTMTVQEGRSASHARHGWEAFTNAVISAVNDLGGAVFMLWGNHARKKSGLIDEQRHLILRAPHPSPLSARRGFFGCRHFSQANEYLRTRGVGEIAWGGLGDKVFIKHSQIK